MVFLRTMLVLLVSIFVLEDTEAFSTDFQRWSNDLALKNKLGFGEKCTYTTEQGRQNLMTGFGEGLSKDLISGFLDVDTPRARKFLNYTVALPGLLCNQSQNLGCLSSGTCGCAEKDQSLALSLDFIREGNECVLKPGSSCFPTYSDFRSRSPFRLVGEIKIACPTTAKCIIKQNNEFCTTENFGKFAIDLAKSGKINFAESVSTNTMKSFCVCGTPHSAIASVLILALSAISHTLL